MKLIFSMLMIALSFSTFAHTTLKTSTPKDNAMLMSSPPELSLVFTKPVRLARVTLQSKSGETIPFEFKPSTELASAFSYELPGLPVDTYTVNWMLLGQDGHKMEGAFSFMVHASMMKHDDKKHDSTHGNH